MGGAAGGVARETRVDEGGPRGVPRARARGRAAGEGRGGTRGHEVHDEAEAVHVALGRRARAAVELRRRPRVRPAHRRLRLRYARRVSKVSVCGVWCFGVLVIRCVKAIGFGKEVTNPSLSWKESLSGQMKQFSGLMSRCRNPRRCTMRTAFSVFLCCVVKGEDAVQ